MFGRIRKRSAFPRLRVRFQQKSDPQETLKGQRLPRRALAGPLRPDRSKLTPIRVVKAMAFARPPR
jgi:hypothetical protein